MCELEEIEALIKKADNAIEKARENLAKRICSVCRVNRISIGIKKEYAILVGRKVKYKDGGE